MKDENKLITYESGDGKSAIDFVLVRKIAFVLVNCAWQKFRELSPILTVKGISLKLKCMLYKSCVQSVM